MEKPNLAGMDFIALMTLRNESAGELAANQFRYNERYGEDCSANSVSDDYNGEGEECQKLNSLIGEIDAELQKGRGLGKILSRAETLYKQDSDFACEIYSNCNWRIIQSPCPKCQSPVLCVYADMARTEFADTYNHICMNLDCDYLLKETIPGLTMGARDSSVPENCPFCERKI
jgi:hypothetical protein